MHPNHRANHALNEYALVDGHFQALIGVEHIKLRGQITGHKAYSLLKLTIKSLYFFNIFI